ncbi:UDP-glucose:glycoprotein glucosyltransferase 2 [Borealophlyctis nickersoniae]|nr:UDP-glucose:glycoprotein glucosyltransferase 2 [Borealophlyctis nickersoniae]
MSIQRQSLWPTVLVVCLFFAHILTCLAADSPPVVTKIRTEWPAPPLALEAVEFVAREKDVDTFSFISQLASHANLSSVVSTQKSYSGLLSLIVGDGKNTYLSRPASLPLLKLALSVHSNAPRVQAYYQFYEESVVPTFESRGGEFNPDCESWVDWYGIQACTATDLDILVKSDRGDASGHSSSHLLPFDHIYDPSPADDARVAILYTDLFSNTFLSFHKRLMELAETTDLVYVLRYRPPLAGDSDPLFLSGYGVELAIKSTEYKVIDDRDVQKDDGSSEASTESATSSPEASDLLHEDVPTIKPVTKEDLKGMRHRTVQYILDSSDPLAAFARVTQDFPKYAHILANIPVNNSVDDEIQKNQQTIARAGLWLNGMELDQSRVDVFSLLRSLRSEADLVSSLTALHFTPQQAVDLLSTGLVQNAESDTEWGASFDVRSDAVIWWNDLAVDKRYSRWPSGIRELLRPAYQSQLKYVRKNIFNVVFALNLATESHLKVMGMVFEFMAQSVPVRVGVVPLVDEGNEDSAASMIAKAVYHLVKHGGGLKVAREFIMLLLEAQRAHGNELAPSEVKEAFKKVAGTPLADVSSVEVADYLVKAAEFENRLGLSRDDGAFFINGKMLTLDDNWQQSMLAVYFQMLEYLGPKVYLGEIDDKTDVYDHFMSLPSVYPRRNPFIFTSETNRPKIVDLLRAEHENVIDRLTWLAADESTFSSASIFVVADFETVEGVRLAIAGLEYAIAHRLAKTGKASALNELISHALEAVDGGKATLEGAEKLLIADGNSETIPVDETEEKKLASDLRLFVAETLGIEAGQRAVVVNGRVVGPLPSEAKFVADDFKLLATIERQERFGNVAAKVVALAENVKHRTTVDDQWYSNTILKVTSLVGAVATEATSGIASMYYGDKMRRLNSEAFLAFEKGVTTIKTGDYNKALFRFNVIIDPLTDDAQKVAALLNVLSRVEGTYMEITFKPALEVGEKLPISRFYRYVLTEEIQFNPETGLAEPAVAVFRDIPVEPLLTLGMDVAGSWLVHPTKSIYDLDNIRLSSLKGEAKRTGVEADFALKNILVEGHARDTRINGPPRGLQFVLGTPRRPAMVDTITMSNLGYLQLKANPGVWDLRLRPGRSRDLYDIESVGDRFRQRQKTDGNNLIGDEGARIVVNSFEGVTLFPIVRKKQGKEAEDVLEDGAASKEDKKGGIWKHIKGSIFKHEHKKVNNTVNVFSVASGHLYERFLSIMMLSVVKQTKSNVKFWLIENFLSPSFMEFIPHLAKAYGFEYELVTYKWPHWLRGQTEKQRVIWGLGCPYSDTSISVPVPDFASPHFRYKILFLDVLFPLSLDKVIFVDADQVVRADLQELVDMDLHGAPYGYTPFCDDRKEMDGFRFWKQGYWQNHLSGRPYHISALYVVDLTRFRQMAAGDRLRQQYQMLSADPNSLANLDQDLPNNMMHQIPIFSLPQECDESLKKAKTIDLCNNPLTKEPKLERAKRILPEWEGLDKEVDEVARGFDERRKKGREQGKKAAGKEEGREKDEL